MKKLYAVQYLVKAVVLAENQQEAAKVAERFSTMALQDCEPEVHAAHEIWHADELPAGWEADFFPYGEEIRTLTIGDYLASEVEA